MSKVLITTKDPFDIIVSAVKQAGAAVRPTFGPSSNRVIIDKQMYRMVVDDGVQIMRDLELADPNENAVLKVIKETAIKTNDRVGDGTTGATIMVQEIITGVADLTRRDGHKIERELKAGAKGGGNVLTRKIGPLPGWAWAAIAVGGLYLWKKRQAASTAAVCSAVTSAA